MSDRERLAADLHAAICDYHWPDLLTCGIDHADDADRLIAAGWTRLDEERLARALAVMSGAHPRATGVQRRDVGDYRLGLTSPHVIPTVAEFAAAIAKAYRDDHDRP